MPQYLFADLLIDDVALWQALKHVIEAIPSGYNWDLKEQSPAFFPYFICHLYGPPLPIL